MYSCQNEFTKRTESGKKSPSKIRLIQCYFEFFFLLNNLKLFRKLKLKSKLSKIVCLTINEDSFFENKKIPLVNTLKER